MALRADVAVRGVPIEQAYIRVEPLILTKTVMSFRVITLTGEDQDVPFAVEDCTCDYDLDGPNPWVQAYTYLKTLPEFAKAVDKLEAKTKPVPSGREDTGPRPGPARVSPR